MENSGEELSVQSGKRLTGWLASWLAPLLIFLLTTVVFSPVLWNEFVNWDDDTMFLRNPHYRGLGWAELRWMFTPFHMGFYGPLTWITYGLDYLLWGMNPAGYHLTSLLLHAMNGVLVYFLSLRLLSVTLSIPGGTANFALRAWAGVAALLFAVHPLRVEPVAGASARPHLLSALFLLCSVLCYLRYAIASDADPSRRRRLTVSIAAYALSLLSMMGLGITLPVVLLVMDVYPLKRLGGPGRWFGATVRPVWWEKLPFVLLGLGAAVVSGAAKEQVVVSLAAYDVGDRLAQSFFGLVFYLVRTTLPFNLSPIYPLVRVANWSALAVVVLLLSLCFYLFRRRWPAGLACWVCYVVILSPVLGLFQSGPQLVADRYSYLPCLGWAILAGGGFYYLWNRPGASPMTLVRRGLGTAVTALVIVGFEFLTLAQVQVWRNSERLWTHVLRIAPNTIVAHNNLGVLLRTEGRLEEAALHFNEILKINPDHARAHHNLGLIKTEQGELDEAIAYLSRTAELDPVNEIVHYRLAVALGLRGRLDEAIAHLHKAIAIRPSYAEAHESLAQALDRQGKRDEAAQHSQEARRLLESRSREPSP